MKSLALCTSVASTLLITSCSRSPLAPAPAPESPWSLVASAEELTSVSGTSSDDVYVLGHAGTLFHHDGLRWTASMPFDHRLYWSKLWCASPRDIFAVGNSRVVDGRLANDYQMYHYDGSAASRMNMNIRAPILDLWGSAADNVVAVGRGGQIQRYDGTSWQPMESGTTKDIYAIWGLPSGELFALLRNSVLFYEGTAWTEILTSSATLTDIWASSREDIYVAQESDALLHFDGQTWTRIQGWWRKVWGTASNDVYAASYGDRIAHYDGQSWQTTSLSTERLVIHDLWTSSGAGAFVVGNGDDDQSGPEILHFDGTRWNHEAKDVLLPFNRSLKAIAANDQELVVGGDYFTLLRLDGSIWKRIAGADAGPISDIWMGRDNSLVALGDYGHDALFFDGTSWTAHANVLASGDGHEGVWGSNLNDVVFVGDRGEIVHFDGSTFRNMESNATALLYDVWGRSGAEVYAVGAGGTIIAYDGESWRPMESHTTDDLRAIWGDTEFAVAVGGSGTILHLEEGRWIPAASPTLERLTGVWGTSSRDVYAVGDQVVLHHDGSRWSILSDTVGGTAVWGRASDDVYVVEPRRILHYGPSPSGANR